MFKLKFVFPLLFAALLVAVPLVFLFTFDFDTLKSKAERIVEAKTGSAFSVGALRIGLRGGLSFELDKARLAGSGESVEPLATAESVSIRVKFWPLLQKRFEVTDVLLVRPRIALARDAAGKWNLPEFPKGGMEGAAYLISRLRVEDGEIAWSDAAHPANAGAFTRIDAEISDLSPLAPIAATIEAALPDSAGRNFEWSGKIGPFSGLSEPSVDGSFKVDLGPIDPAAVRARFPQIRDFPVSNSRLEGVLEGTVRGPLDLKKLEVEGRLALERVESPLFRAPLENFKTFWFYREGSAGIKEATAKWGQNGTLEADARVDTPFEIPVAHVQLALRNVEAHDMTPKRPGRWEVYGSVNADGEFHFDPRGTAAVLASLGGKGQFELSKGILTNMNVLALITQKVSSFVGFDVRANIHPGFQPLLQYKDMALTLVQSRFSIEGGNARVNEVSVVSNEFDVRGGGYVSLAGRMKLDCGLFISPALSAEYIRSVPDFAALTDPSGRLLFPFTVAGNVRQPSFAVDKDYLTSRIVAVKGQQLIQNVFSKGANTASDAGSSAGNLLKNVF